MKNLIFILTIIFTSLGVIAQQDSKSSKQIKLQKIDKQIAASNDGTPDYKLSVEESYRKIQYKMSIYGDVIVKANHEQNTMLIADCVPAYYGMTHPAPNYYYLKDRRPELYKKLTDEKVDFHNERGDETDLETDFFKRGFFYKENCVHDQ